MPDGTRTRLAVLGAGLLLLNVWEWIFGAFFPTRDGTLGHDWAHKLPLLLDGTNWFLQNGWRALPWFTPSFCGGIPLFPHPASFYVSLPQVLSFVTDPLRAAHYALLVFAGAGLAGTYVLLRRVYRVSEWAALLGAGVFLFNGFFAHRMLIGHLEFHAFMLTPLLAALLLSGGGRRRARQTGAEVLAAGAVVAYFVLSGATQLAFAVGLTLTALWLLAALSVPDFAMRAFPARLAAAGALGLLLSAGKLAGSLAILSHFPRDFYPLPAIEGLRAAAWLTLVALVRGGRAVDLGQIVNSEFPVQLHELEYGVTAVPFLLLAAWAGRSGLRRPRARGAAPKNLLCGAALAVLLALPVALNVQAVGGLLGQVPVFRSLSTLLRWLATYILPLAVAAGLAVDRLELPRRLEIGAVAAALATVIALNAFSDRTYYHAQLYPPGPVVAASERVRARGAPTPIRGIEASVVGGEIQLSINRNDVMVRGMSQLACYEPLFGFRLERFPRQDLHPGPVLEARAGRLNLKNPACYVYPVENGCEPGDHFRSDQIEEATRFTRFQAYGWERSRVQRIADAVSVAALAVYVAAGIGLAVAALRDRRR